MYGRIYTHMSTQEENVFLWCDGSRRCMRTSIPTLCSYIHWHSCPRRWGVSVPGGVQNGEDVAPGTQSVGMEGWGGFGLGDLRGLFQP